MVLEWGISVAGTGLVGDEEVTWPYILPCTYPAQLIILVSLFRDIHGISLVCRGALQPDTINVIQRRAASKGHSQLGLGHPGQEEGKGLSWPHMAALARLISHPVLLHTQPEHSLCSEATMVTQSSSWLPTLSQGENPEEQYRDILTSKQKTSLDTISDNVTLPVLTALACSTTQSVHPQSPQQMPHNKTSN